MREPPLTSQFLTESMGAATIGAWLDGADHGASLLIAVPEPATGLLLLLTLGGLSVWGVGRLTIGV